MCRWVSAAITCIVALRVAVASPPETLAPAPPALPEEFQPFEPSPRDLHWCRMLAEAAILFGIQEAVYWSAKESNAFDFEYNADWRNLRERLWTYEAWKLDDNYFNTNGWRHTAQGGLNYLFARSNGFSSVQSYVVSLALSVTWELLGEYKEEVSLNDLIVTPRSGAVAAESVWQLGVFFLRGKPTLLNQIAGNALTLGHGLLDRWDGKPSVHSTNTNRLGFDRDVAHRFELSVVGGQQLEAGTSRGIVRFALDTELIMIPGFDRPGRGRQLRTAPSFTQIHAHITRDEDAITDFRARARAAVTAWNRKDIAPDGNGWNLIYGLSSAYEYGHHASNEREGTRTRDRVAIAHLLGPTVDLVVHRDAMRLRAVVDAYANFALLRNHAIDSHLAQFPDEEVRSTIVRDNYYHALGLSGRVRLELSYAALAAGLAYQHDRFKSVQGIDRHQEDLVQDYPLYDKRGEGQAWLRYGFRVGSDLSLELELSGELRTRSGRVKRTEDSEQELRYLGGARLVF